MAFLYEINDNLADGVRTVDKIEKNMACDKDWMISRVNVEPKEWSCYAKRYGEGKKTKQTLQSSWMWCSNNQKQT